MKAEQLWASILQDAIQGKLVPQLESEPEVTQVGNGLKAVPYEIPKKWKWVTLSSIASLLNGRAYSKNELLDDAPGRTPVLRVGNFFTNGSWYYSDLKLDSNKYCDNGDLLFAWSASFGPKIWNGGKCIYHYHIWKVICSKSVDKEWLYFWLLAMSERLKSSSGRGSTMIHITKRETEQVPLALPPIEEQRRIVKRLYELKKLVEIYQREEKELVSIEATFPEKLRASILQDAIQGRLVPQLESEPKVDIIGEEPKSIPFNAPEKWKWVKFSNVASLLNGRAYSKSELLNKAPGRVPVLRVGNFFTNGSWYYSDLKLEPNKYCDDNDLLFAWSASFGPKIWNGGRCIYHYHIWKVICSEYVDKEWLYFWLLSMAEKLKSTSGRGSTMIHITKKETEQIPLALPPLEEQRRIVKTIKSLFQYIGNIKSI